MIYSSFFIYTLATIISLMIWRTVIFCTTGWASCRNIESVTVCGSRETLFAVTTWPVTENMRPLNARALNPSNPIGQKSQRVCFSKKASLKIRFGGSHVLWPSLFSFGSSLAKPKQVGFCRSLIDQGKPRRISRWVGAAKSSDASQPVNL